jgi:hypothetical protein
MGDGVAMQSPTKRRVRVYEGMRSADRLDTGGEVIVTVNGQTLPVAPSLKLRNHSPTGFSWGYGGSGPAQLALAILHDYYGARRALRLYQSFKWATVARWPAERNWKITGAEIDELCRAIEPD